MAYGIGQVAGLLLAATTVKHLTVGWWIAGVAILAGFVIGRIGVPTLRSAHAAGDLPAETSWRSVGAISWVLHAFHRPRYGISGRSAASSRSSS